MEITPASKFVVAHNQPKPAAPRMMPNQRAGATSILPDGMGRAIVRCINLSMSRSTTQLIVLAPAAESVPPIRVDAAQIAAAVTELLKNAMEASPKEMIRLRVQVDDHDGRLMIEVRDDGRGMSERTLEHAFDPFFSEKEAGRQPGLGLAKARRLVELHAGRVELESSAGSGTVARIVLPTGERREQASDAA